MGKIICRSHVSYVSHIGYVSQISYIIHMSDVFRYFMNYLESLLIT